jgi:hypothetical protein
MTSTIGRSTRLLVLLTSAALSGMAFGGEAAGRATSGGEGIVRVLPAELAGWGLSSSGRVYVYTDGRGLDYRWTADGGVEFYSAPYESLYARERAFLISNRALVSKGASEEAAVKPVPAGARRRGAAPRATPASYMETCHVEENQFYVSGLSGAAAGEEHWFYSTFLMPGRKLTLTANLAGPLAAGAGRLTVALRGGIDTAGVAPDHRVTVSVNGTLVGEVTWDGAVRKEATLDVPAGLLVEGANAVELAGQSLPGVPYYVAFVDWVEVQYPRGLVARGDRVEFDCATAAGAQAFAVGGFSGADVVGFDVTDPTAPALLALTVKPDGGSWTVQFVEYYAGSHRYALAGPGGRLAASSSRSADPWSARSGGSCSYLVVSHADYLAAAARLAALHGNARQSRALEASKVYDAFGCGQPVPDAFREAVKHTGARYLCLVGDATGDPRELLGPAGCGVLPSYFSQGDTFEGASDGLMGCTNGDGYPEAAVGRLPVRSLSEANVLVDKAAARLAQTGEGYGGAEAALVVGDNDQAIFEQGAEEMAGLFTWGAVDRVMFSSYASSADIRTAILAGWAKKPRYFVYYGHGASTYLGKGQVLSTTDVPSLDAGGDLPAGVLLCCLAGYYNFTNGSDSLAERLVKEPGKGLCAAVAPSGMSPSELQRDLGREIVRALGQGKTLGEALVIAKRKLPAQAGADIRGSFNILGDPALK